MKVLLFFLSEGWASARRAPAASVAAVTAVAAVLFVLLLLMLLSHNVLLLSDRLQERKGLSVFLEPGLAPDRVSELEQRFAGFSEVAAVKLCSREQALQDVERDLGSAGLTELLGGNPLPDVVQITPLPHAGDASTLARLAQEIEAYPGVEDVLYGERWVEALDRGLATVRRVDMLTGGLAMLAIVLVLATTLRLLVLMREEQLGIMKVIGATDAFVRAPFVVAGVWLCLIGALVALGFAYAAVGISAGLLPGVHFLPPQRALLFLLGVAGVGFVGSLVTVEASIHQVERRSRRVRG